MASDPRIPVLFGGVPQADEAVLVEGADPVQPGLRFDLPANMFNGAHAAGCTCCRPRGPATTAMTTLFLARSRGEMPFFARLRVLASKDGEAAVRAALADDLLTAARFRPS